MTERGALTLVFCGMILVASIAMLGLSALHAGVTAVFLGVIGPLVIGSYLCSLVVIHYGASNRSRR